VMTEKRRLSRITSMDDVRGIPAGKLITIKVKVETITPAVMREVRQITRSMRAAIVEASAATTSGESAAAAKASSAPSTKPRAPKDTAEMLLPWFSLELEITDDSEALPMVPVEFANLESGAAHGGAETQTPTIQPAQAEPSSTPQADQTAPAARRIAP